MNNHNRWCPKKIELLLENAKEYSTDCISNYHNKLGELLYVDDEEEAFMICQFGPNWRRYYGRIH